MPWTPLVKSRLPHRLPSCSVTSSSVVLPALGTHGGLYNRSISEAVYVAVMVNTHIAVMILMLMVAEADAALREPRTAAGLRHDVGRLSRRLTAYNINSDDDDDDDARWLLMGVAAAAAGVTSLMTMFALCTCCRRKNYR